MKVFPWAKLLNFNISCRLGTKKHRHRCSCHVTEMTISYRDLLQCKGVPTYCGVNIVLCSRISDCAHFDAFFSSKVMNRRGCMTVPRACPQIRLAVTTSGANVAWRQGTSTHHHAVQSPSLFVSWFKVQKQWLESNFILSKVEDWLHYSEMFHLLENM